MQKIRLTQPHSCGLTSLESDAVTEQNEYLLGVLYADADHRLDGDSTRDVATEIDAYGTCTKAFWRAVVETAGYLSMTQRGAEGGHPLFSLQGSYRFLHKLLEFLEEELGTDSMPWDADGRFEFQCGGQHVKLSGKRVQDIVRVLYVDHTIARESSRRVADKILGWTPKR